MKLLLAIALFAMLGLAHAQIKQTAILFRHGQRTPDQEIGVLRSETADDFGLGYLTQYGSWQQYENGLFLRLRYLHLFPADGYFRSRYMRLMTSIPDRTIMSIQSFMAGILPPPIKDLKLPIVWQPFSSTIDLQSKYLHFKPEACPTYNVAYNDLIHNPPADVLAWFEQDNDQIEALSAHVGYPLRSVMALYYVGDFVQTNLFLGDYVPDWALEAYNTFLPKYMTRYFQMTHETDFMTQVRGGPVITQIIENMEAYPSVEARNIIIYSAHDMTVESLIRVLGVRSQTPELVNYADTVLIELVDNGGSEMQVQALYVDNSGAIPNRFAVNVPGCGTLCSLSTFKSVVSKFLVPDYEKLCGL